MTHPLRTVHTRSHPPRRALARQVGVAAVLSAMLLALLPLSPAAAARPARADRAADWEVTQLERGRIRSVAYDVTDWGLTVDTYFALVAAGNRAKQARNVVRTVSKKVHKYVSYDGDFFAGQLAKTLLARRVAGLDPSIEAANLNLRRKLTSLIAASGRVRDTGQSDLSNTLSQALSVLALSRSGRLRPSTVDFLARQQCNRGFFRLQVKGTDCRRGPADVDATAYAVQALVRARWEGVDLPRRAVSAAADWLVRAQHRNGSFSETPGGAVNTNSTGLAAQALTLVNRDRAAHRAGRWVAGLQLTRARAAGTPARRDLGAIAFSRADLRLALEDGVTKAKRDAWRRSTSQALLALAPRPLTTLRLPGRLGRS